MSAPVRLQRADDDLGYVEALLAENDLPTADVRSVDARFYIALDGEDRVGVGGLEQYGSDGLLRSVAVERSARGDGVGTAICEGLEGRARDAGVEALYLLTTTAAGFFAARGYDEIEQAAAPAAVRETTEFADLCPDSAVCMTKSL